MQFKTAKQLWFWLVHRKVQGLISYELKHKYSHPSWSLSWSGSAQGGQKGWLLFCFAVGWSSMLLSCSLPISCFIHVSIFSSWILSCCLWQSQQLHLRVTTFHIFIKNCQVKLPRLPSLGALSQDLDHRNMRLKVHFTILGWFESNNLSIHSTYVLKWIVGGRRGRSILGAYKKRSNCHLRLLFFKYLSRSLQSFQISCLSFPMGTSQLLNALDTYV